MADTMATYRIHTSNFPAVLNDKGDLGFARVTTNQHGVTLAFDKYDELPVVKNERTGALGRRGTVVTDVCLDPADNNWILLNTKHIIVPLNQAIQTTKDLTLREVSPASEWKDVKEIPL